MKNIMSRRQSIITFCALILLPYGTNIYVSFNTEYTLNGLVKPSSALIKVIYLVSFLGLLGNEIYKYYYHKNYVIKNKFYIIYQGGNKYQKISWIIVYLSIIMYIVWGLLGAYNYILVAWAVGFIATFFIQDRSIYQSNNLLLLDDRVFDTTVILKWQSGDLYRIYYISSKKKSYIGCGWSKRYDFMNEYFEKHFIEKRIEGTNLF